MIRHDKGVTLLELMIATAILSISVLSLIGVFTQITAAVQSSKSKSLATNLVQEKIEALKNIPYHRLLVTTSPLTETKVTTPFLYDTSYYPPEESLNVGGIIFDRRVYIHKVAEKADGTLEHKDWSDGDTALKEIQVNVLWKQRNEWKHLRASNLRDDPDRAGTNAVFSGIVTDGASNLEDVKVDIIQNSAWNALTNDSGYYSFQLIAGTYTLRASKSGYFTAFSGQKTVLDVETVNFTLLKMASGTITGTAYIRDHIVISQVVASTNPAGTNYEWIELFNPTTYAWTLSSATLVLNWQKTPGENFLIDASHPNLTELKFHDTVIPAAGYFLIGSHHEMTVGGTTLEPEAHYDPQGAQVIKEGGAAGLRVIVNGVVQDRLGWSKGSTGQTAPAAVIEGTQLTLDKGLQAGEQIVRGVSSYTVTATEGNAWDTDDNSADFNLTVSVIPADDHDMAVTLLPRNSADSLPPLTGTPVSGAIVFTNDNLAPAVTVDADGSFTLLSVATGTWTLTVSSSLVTKDIAGVTVTDSVTTNAGIIVLSSVSETGYVTGWVKDSAGSGINNILVMGGGGCNINTDPNGNYRLAASTGLQQIVANPNNDNPNYVSSAQNVTVTLGDVVPNRDFTLAKGASLKGFSSSNGVDAYPGLVAIAKLDGMEQGSAVAEANGYFIITNLSTGSYIVEAIPDSGESVTPSTHTITIYEAAAGDTLWIGTFTVSGAMGSISGTLRENSSAINTGVLIVVTSATITGFPPVPPAIDNSLRSGFVKYFNASSGADGNYSVPVIGGYTYNVYAWYTNIDGTTVCKSSSTTESVTAGKTKTVDFSWP